MARNAPLQSERKNEKQIAATMADDVDKIRDIIFGGQMREYAARFEELEKMVNAKIDRLSADMEKHFDRLAERLEAERKEREKAVETASAELHGVKKAITEDLTNAEEHWATEAAKLQGALGDGHQELFAAIERAKEELAGSLAAEAARLEKHKLATDDLAQMFVEIARGLKKPAR
jgi:ribosome-associated translation inhibitor RaiA